MGFNCAARRAGYSPKKIPTAAAKLKASAIAACVNSGCAASRSAFA